jgi:hypothetical protein
MFAHLHSDRSDEAQVAASGSLEQAFITGAAAMSISIDNTIDELLLHRDSAESTARVSTGDNRPCCSCYYYCYSCYCCSNSLYALLTRILLISTTRTGVS